MSARAMTSATAELTPLGSVIDGDVVLRGAPAYESLYVPARRQTRSLRPLAIIRCRSAQDVAEALSLARRLRIPVAPRSGDHRFAGRSSSKGAVMDLSPMRTLDVAGAVAVVGAGVRLGPLYEGLDRHGPTVPAVELVGAIQSHDARPSSSSTVSSLGQRRYCPKRTFRFHQSL